MAGEKPAPAVDGIEGLPATIRHLGVGGALVFLLRARDRVSLANALAKWLVAELKAAGVKVSSSSPDDALTAWRAVADARLALRLEAAAERWAVAEKSGAALDGVELEPKGEDETDWSGLSLEGGAGVLDAERAAAWSCARSRPPGAWRAIWEAAPALVRVQGVGDALRVLARREEYGAAVARELGRFIAASSARELKGTLGALVAELEGDSGARQESIRQAVLRFAVDVKRYVRARDIGRAG